MEKTKSKAEPQGMTYTATLLKQKENDTCPKMRKRRSSMKISIHKKAVQRSLQRRRLKKQPPTEREADLSPSQRCMVNEEQNHNNQLKKRSKRKKSKAEKNVDELSQLQRRARYLMVKLKLEQNFIDAYSNEGWKGQSREKLRPEKELFRAKMRVLKCKLGLRDVICRLDFLSSVGQIDGSLMAPDGSIHHDHIYCAKCKLREASEDNDIILCDGTCNRAFHQKCLDPPLSTLDIPSGDEGWFCRFCECRLEILEAMNAHLGTQFSAADTSKDIFKEEASLPDGVTPALNEEEWPDDDSDDNDYDPIRDCNDGRSFTATEGDPADGECSSSSQCSLESEEFPESGLSPKGNRKRNNNLLMIDGLESDQEIITGPRQRHAVDYRKLYNEMFGNDASLTEQVSEDEDWGPPRKRQRGKECDADAATALMTLLKHEKKHPGLHMQEGEEKLDPQEDSTRPRKSRPKLTRFPMEAVEKLRQVFAEDQLPSKSIKERISEEFGLQYNKVDKWFKNARYLSLKARREAMGGAEQRQSSPCPESSKPCQDAVSVTKGGRVESSSAPKLCKLKQLRRRVVLRSKRWWQQRMITEDEAENILESREGVSLKKQLSVMKAERNERKIRNTTPASLLNCAEEEERQQRIVDSEEIVLEMERLCQLKSKVWKLKQQLLQAAKEEDTEAVAGSERNGGSPGHDVVYIPVTNLKEKVR